MLFAVLFEDNDGHRETRKRHMSAHLAFLSRNAARIESAGPLSNDGMPAGGLWIVRAENPEEVQVLVETDPFWPTGLRKSVRILEWTRVFGGD